MSGSNEQSNRALPTSGAPLKDSNPSPSDDKTQPFVLHVRPMSSESKSKFELFVDLMRAILWPAFAFTILVVFRQPLQTAAMKLSERVADVQTFSLGGFKIELARDLRRELSPDVIESLDKISPEALGILLRNVKLDSRARSSAFTIPIARYPEGLPQMRHGIDDLISRALLERTINEKGDLYHFVLTPKGERAGEEFIKILSQVLKLGPKDVATKD